VRKQKKSWKQGTSREPKNTHGETVAENIVSGSRQCENEKNKWGTRELDRDKNQGGLKPVLTQLPNNTRTRAGGKRLGRKNKWEGTPRTKRWLGMHAASRKPPQMGGGKGTAMGELGIRAAGRSKVRVYAGKEKKGWERRKVGHVDG